MSPGTTVIVYSFGQHVGRVLGPSDTEGWISIRLHDGRIWNGTPRDVERATISSLASRERYLAESER